MLDIKFIRENPEKVKKSITDRGLELDIDELLSLYKKRRALLIEVDKLKHKRNIASKEVARCKGEKEEAGPLLAEMKTVSHKIKEIDAKVGEIDKKIYNIAIDIPNIPHSTVPVGPDPKSNKLIKERGKLPNFDFNPLTHIELGEYLHILDFPRSSKLAGTGFCLFVGDGARMVRALMDFMLELHTKEHGYKEVWPPALVSRPCMTATGQLPKLEEDMYRLKDEDLFLIPTAEVPVTNIHRNEVLNEDELPIYYTAYTPCFRREAGSYGKDTKGLTRVHQFDKVELVKFVRPKDSYKELESLLSDAEEVIQLLELPYRVMALSTGDLSFAASKCYDIELWAPGIATWLEVSSCSNFEDFQARRANIKFREISSRKLSYVHTLNGSGVAFARLIIAILENYQKIDGTVEIPKALQPYMGNQKVIKPPKK